MSWLIGRRAGSAERRRLTQGPGRPRADVAAVVGPSSVVTTGNRLRVGDGYAATVFVAGYPAEVGMAWLEPLIGWPGQVDVALHIDPLPTAAAAARLRRQRARLESSRRIDADRGRLDDPLVDAAAADAADLAGLVARGESRLFNVGIYLTVHAPTPEELGEAVAEIRAAAASVLLDTHPATWRHLQGWISTLPLGHDALGMRRVMDTDALATAFPLACPDLPEPLPGDPDVGGGVLYGVNTASGGILWWDRWAQDNHNSVVLARSGAGKSYLVKLDVLRQLYDGVQVHVIDPEDEYVRLAEAVGGTVIRFGVPGVRLNPLDLPPGDTRPDALTRRALFVHTLVAVLLGDQPPPAERAALDRAILATYAEAGITHDPATWTRPAPLLQDVVAALTRAPEHTTPHPTHGKPNGRTDGKSDVNTDGRSEAAIEEGAGHAAAVTLAARLAPWTEGSFRDLFDGPTTTRPVGHLVLWSVRHLPDELRAAGMLLALDAIWHDIDTPPDVPPVATPGVPPGVRHDGSPVAPIDPPPDRRPRVVRPLDWLPNSDDWLANRQDRLANSQTPWWEARPSEPAPRGRAVQRRLVVVDEAWTLMREREGARFLARMAKSARKRAAGLAVITQDAADLLSSDLGQVVVANAASQLLMRQAPQAIDAVAATFGLTTGEARLLTSAERGQALLLAGPHRVTFQVVASAEEHRLAAGWTDLPDTDDQIDEHRDATSAAELSLGRAAVSERAADRSTPDRLPEVSGP